MKDGVSCSGAAAAVFLLCACAGQFGPSDAAIPALAIENHEFNLRRYIGRTVRVCGRIVREQSHWGVARIPPPEEFYFHGPPTVLVATTADEPPRLDRNGCIAGRIATKNGALTLPLKRRVEWDDSPIDREWFLHPQYPGRQNR